MSRVLVHYDIHDQAIRDAFQSDLVSGTFGETFHKVTESVYATDMDTVEDSVEQLIINLVAHFSGQNLPSGTRVFVERPGLTNDVPDIIRVPIVQK